MLLAVHHRVMEHLGSLESTQEARDALGYASGNSYASFVLSKLPACSITRWCTLKHEPIVNVLIAGAPSSSSLLFTRLILEGRKKTKEIQKRNRPRDENDQGCKMSYCVHCYIELPWKH